MASCYVLNTRTAVVEVSIPKHVIIYNGMNLQKWKDYFIQKRTEATASAEKLNYNECFKTLLYAELCNAELIKVGNSKNNDSLTIKFTFEFDNWDCMMVFARNLEVLAVVSQVF